MLTGAGKADQPSGPRMTPPVCRAVSAALGALLAAVPESVHAWEAQSAEGGPTWQVSATPPWRPHTGSIAAPLSDGSVLLLAGQAGEHGGALFDCFNCTSEVWSFDQERETWTNKSEEVPWEPRWGHSAAVEEDDTVWLLFGCCEKGRPTVMFRDVWTYNPLKRVPWTRMATEPPFEGIQATSVALWGEDLWVCGGWSQSRGTLSQVATLSTKTLAWTVRSEHGEAPWRHRADHATAVSPDGAWLFLYAGQHRDDKTGHWFRLKDTWRVPLLGEAKAAEWQQLGDLNAARSSVPVLVLPTGFLLSLGGHFVPDDEELKTQQSDVQGMIDHHRAGKFQVHNDVLALDLRGDGCLSGWRVVEQRAPWPARDDCAAAVGKDGAVLLFGGGTLYGGGGYLQDVWRLPAAATAYSLEATLLQAEKRRGGEL